MPRRTSPRQLDRFLRNLACTGNITLAADLSGLARSGIHKRKRRDGDFAAAVARAFRAFAQASVRPERSRGAPVLTAPGDFHLATYAGQPQLRRLPVPLTLSLSKGHPEPVPSSAEGPSRRAARITDVAIHAFLAALAEGASVRRAAAAAGFTHPSFYARARARPALAREIAVALAIGADRRTWARIERFKQAREQRPDFDADIPVPQMTVEQALMQLMFHRPGGPFQASPKRQRRRSPPTPLATLARPILAKLRAVRRAAHFEATGKWRLPEEEP